MQLYYQKHVYVVLNTLLCIHAVANRGRLTSSQKTGGDPTPNQPG
jgi:hypothetical protein